MQKRSSSCINQGSESERRKAKEGVQGIQSVTLTMYIAKTIKGLEDIAAQEVKGEVILPQTILFKKQKKEYQTVNAI